MIMTTLIPADRHSLTAQRALPQWIGKADEAEELEPEIALRVRQLTASRTARATPSTRKRSAAMPATDWANASRSVPSRWQNSAIASGAPFEATATLDAVAGLQTCVMARRSGRSP